VVAGLVAGYLRCQPWEKMMIPTTRFRYIERQDFTDDLANPQTLRILQQWWGIEEDLSIGEWRDIPIEEET
jgi:hypothetical protein